LSGNLFIPYRIQTIDELFLPPVLKKIAMEQRGLVLLTGTTGSGKSTTLAGIMELNFNRVQFTPDLMPSDITGTDVLEEEFGSKQRRFRFIKGPIFTNILLADEINRTTSTGRRALLEAMILGTETLIFSANIALEDTSETKKGKPKREGWFHPPPMKPAAAWARCARLCPVS
jgi:energy-coupling factor transporter ATP-binding protein EcfA2